MQGVLFVPSDGPHAPREKIDLVLDLGFVGKSISVSGEVASVIDPPLAEAGGTSAGVSLRLLEDASRLRSTLEELSGLSLGERAPSGIGQRLLAARSRLGADVRIETREGGSQASPQHLYAGALVLLWRSGFRSVLQCEPSCRARSGLRLMDGKILTDTPPRQDSRARRQFHYPADRIDEV
jgi:Tfp pilus assembly protein PilZ